MTTCTHPSRNTPCYDAFMPNVRFTISTASDVLAAIREHADAAGMDVSAYMVAAAAAQMASDDAITATVPRRWTRSTRPPSMRPLVSPSRSCPRSSPWPRESRPGSVRS